MGKPPFKASNGGQIDIFKEWEEVTLGELQQGSGSSVLVLRFALAFPNGSPMPFGKMVCNVKVYCAISFMKWKRGPTTRLAGLYDHDI